MYEQYYGLLEKPFNLTPDTDFYCKTLTHQDALNTLLVAIKNGDGFIKLTGEVGTGKTLLCRKLLNLLDDSFDTVYIPNPYMSCDALLRAVVEEMDLLDEVQSGNYLSAINKKLINNAQAGRKTVILLDEAQSLPVESLEAIRLLSNLETEKNKLVQIVLFGQPELNKKLMDNTIRQLQQRIVHACELSTLSNDTLEIYVSHRLKSAGYNGPGLFDKSALKLLYKKSRGVPRLINLISNKALMLAYSSGSFYVNAEHVKQAAKDSHQTKIPMFGVAGVVRQLTVFYIISMLLQPITQAML
jgi:MSHA biogenesis protein MshM